MASLFLKNPKKKASSLYKRLIFGIDYDRHKEALSSLFHSFLLKQKVEYDLFAAGVGKYAKVVALLNRDTAEKTTKAFNLFGNS